METNRVNGHQHEVSDKRVNPGAFPCRLDTHILIGTLEEKSDGHAKPPAP